MVQSFWRKSPTTEEDRFLKEFILKKGWVDRKGNSVPTYNQVVGDGEEGGDEDNAVMDLSEEEEFMDKVDDFEREYNFRFEEEGAAQLVSFPRTIDDSVRRKNDRRKEKRKERAERKKQEKAKKAEELKRLKNLKKEEMMQKLQQIAEISGNDVEKFEGLDLDGDFDPDAYDKQMNEKFNEEYYEHEDSERPDFAMDDTEEYGDYEEESYAPFAEDPEFNMDADYEEEPIPVKKEKLTKKQMKKKRLQKGGERPVFDPSAHGSFDQYLDEYYKLDFEDIIGDMPTRFKYREVPANDFGLDVEDILAADDKELNQWASLKKATQYRTYDEEKKDIKKYQKRADRKYQVLSSVYRGNGEELDEEQKPSDSKSARKRKRKNEKKKLLQLSEERSETKVEENATAKKKKKRKTKGSEEHSWIDRKLGKDIVPKSRLDAFRSVPKKK